jgi:hypothetical protein
VLDWSRPAGRVEPPLEDFAVDDDGARSDYGHRPVEFTMALCMEWYKPAINTLEPAPL